MVHENEQIVYSIIKFIMLITHHLPRLINVSLIDCTGNNWDSIQGGLKVGLYKPLLNDQKHILNRIKACQ